MSIAGDHPARGIHKYLEEHQVRHEQHEQQRIVILKKEERYDDRRFERDQKARSGKRGHENSGTETVPGPQVKGGYHDHDKKRGETDT